MVCVSIWPWNFTFNSFYTPVVTEAPIFVAQVPWVLARRVCKQCQAIFFSCLKKQYPVTEHAATFDFWTGCLEIKRCEESKKTLKNPFASRLAEFNTSLKNFSGLQINDILFPLRFDLGEVGIFWRYFYCRWLGDQKMGGALMPIEGLILLLASIQAQIIVRGIRRNETAIIKTRRKKPLRH